MERMSDIVSSWLKDAESLRPKGDDLAVEFAVQAIPEDYRGFIVGVMAHSSGTIIVKVKQIAYAELVAYYREQIMHDFEQLCGQANTQRWGLKLEVAS